MKNEVNRALVAKKKLTILFAALTLCAGLFAKTSVITYTASEKLPETTETGFVEGLHLNAFYAADSTQLTVTHTFDEAEGVGTITLDGEVAIIGERAFYNCAITSITLPESVTTISKSTFFGCSALGSISIPASVTTIGATAFYGCSALASLTFEGNACQEAIAANAFDNVGKTTPALLTLPDNWTGPKPVNNQTKWYGGKFEMSEEPIPVLTTYLDENGEEQEIVAAEVENASEQVTWGTAGETTWYVVKGADVKLSMGAVCRGNVHLILADGAKLTATGINISAISNNTSGIQVSGDGNSLAIYGQANQSGQLIATGGKNAAGIGGGKSGSGSNITINGGTVEATGGDYGAGIGGGRNGAGSNIIINGGKVTATGKGTAAGIGGGLEGAGTNITINGGEVTANCSEPDGAGIGGGVSGSGSNITINGGTITATGSDNAAGIGGGAGGKGTNITINGGVVTAIGGVDAAGIGGGNGGDGTNITITGGTVIATGGENAAGIGGGYKDSGSNIKVATYLIVKAGNEENPEEIATDRTDDTDIASSLRGKHVVTIEPSAEKITLTAADFTVTKDGDWKYDKTEKRVNVEISEEYIMPESSNIDIYYNNDKTVKPIDPGTYQVYIDIEETDTYAAMTGITSDAWKFDIIDPKGAIQAIDDKKEEAMQAINSEAGDFETVPTVQKVLEDAKVNFEGVTITATNTINEATNQSTITTTKDDAISKIDEIEASAKTDIQTAIADFKGSVKNEIDNAATDTKSKIDAFAVSDKVKYDAISEIDKAVAVAKETIDNANFQEQINNAKNSALNEFSKQLAIVEASYAQLQDAKVVAIQKIEEVAADAVAAIDEAAGEYASLQAIWEIMSSKKEEIVSGEGEASHFIGDATDMDEISRQKEEVIQHIKDIKSEAVEKIQEAIADYKQKTIDEINNVATSAKEEIDGLGVDESAKSEAKAQIDNIANMAEQTINAATSKDAIDNAKTQAIADIHNVVQTTKDMWITVREGMTINDYGTLCWDYNLTDIEGAELYSVAGMENNRIILQEVLANETQAGAGYVILATAETLRVKNGLEYAKDPAPAAECNGLQGTFADIVDGAAGAAGNILEGNYIVYNNEWRLCGGYTGLLANRAYLIMNYVPGGTVTQAPGRKYISMPLPKETPTGEMRIENGEMRMDGKYIINGHFVIVKDSKKINAQGIEL